MASLVVRTEAGLMVRLAWLLVRMLPRLVS